jgi:hypothetical protein
MADEDMESNILQSGFRDRVEKLDAGFDSWAISLNKMGIQEAANKREKQQDVENADPQKRVRKNSQPKGDDDGGRSSTQTNKGQWKNNVKQGGMQTNKGQSRNNVRQGGRGGGGAAATGPRRNEGGLDRAKRQMKNQKETVDRMDTSHSMRRGWNKYAFNKGMLSCFSPQNPGYAPRRW